MCEEKRVMEEVEGEGKNEEEGGGTELGDSVHAARQSQ